MHNKYEDTDSIKASKKMLDAAGVKYRQIEDIRLNVERAVK